MVPGGDDTGVALVADPQSPEAFDTADGPFDNPGNLPWMTAVRCASTTNDRLDSHNRQQFPCRLAGVTVERCV